MLLGRVMPAVPRKPSPSRVRLLLVVRAVGGVEPSACMHGEARRKSLAAKHIGDSAAAAQTAPYSIGQAHPRLRYA